MNLKLAPEIEKLKEKLNEEAKTKKLPVQREPTLRALRKLLVEAIIEDDLKWFKMDLKMGQRGKPAQFSIQVCSPVFIAGFFVPVTAGETWALAVKFKKLKLFPLTRAVADQQVNEAVDKGFFVEHSPMNINTHGPGYDEFTEKLKGTKYVIEYGNKPVSGSHKVWLFSANLTDTKPVNYGFHHRGPRVSYAQGESGKYLYKEYSVVNGLIRAHDWHAHSDYSQFLQFMRSFREGINILDLQKAILDKHPAVWDELTTPDVARLPK